MIDFFVRQLRGSELGNFINTTPTIISLYNHYKEKIPVVFDTSFIKELYKYWDKIEIMSMPEAKEKNLKQLVHSGEHSNHQVQEYLLRHNTVTQSKGIKVLNGVPKPFVPEPNNKKQGEYVVIARGCIDHPKAAWAKHKEVGDEIFKYIMGKIKLPIYIVGNTADYKRSLSRMESFNSNITYVLDDINKAVEMIHNCKYMIANDTGLFHVAGSFNKKIFVIWKSTPLIKNKSAGENCTYSMQGNWEKDFDGWFNERV
jgi:ADP-heptose:LPS heptosyltransferase